jgi:hypothetical protein
VAMILISAAALAAQPNIAGVYLDRHRRHNALARIFARVGHGEHLLRPWFQGRMTRPLPLLWNFAVILSITAGIAMAQLNTGTTTVYFSLYDPNSGAQHIHVEGWGIPGTQSAHGLSGALLVSLSKGATTGVYLPVSFAGETGTKTQTEISFFLRYRFDTLDFLDTSPSWSNSGRTGTAILRLPTGGSFHGATGFFNYTLTCGQGCPMGSGPAFDDSFDGNISGTGQMNLPTAAAQALLPNLYPPPPGFLQRVKNNLAAAMGVSTSPSTPGPIQSPDDPRDAGAAATPFFSAIPTLQPNAVSYTATATCANLPTSCWLTTPSASGTIPAFGTTAITANFSPGNLPEGVYPADLMLALTPSPSAPAVAQHSPAVLILNNAPVLQLSEAAFQFVALAGSSPQSHAVQIAGSTTQPLSWTANASTLSGGNWLTGTPGSGVASSVIIAANPAGLAPGNYFGRVEIAASGAASSPQSVIVQLTVVATGTEPVLSTSGLVFVAAQNTTPAPQSLQISTLSPTPIPITAGHEEDDDMPWFSIHYTAFSVEAGAPVTLTVFVDPQGLAAGAYTGTVNVQNTADLSTYQVNVLLVVTPSGGQCTPTQLLPVITSLGQGFEVSATVPVSLQTQVVGRLRFPTKLRRGAGDILLRRFVLRHDAARKRPMGGYLAAS